LCFLFCFLSCLFNLAAAACNFIGCLDQSFLLEQKPLLLHSPAFFSLADKTFIFRSTKCFLFSEPARFLGKPLRLLVGAFSFLFFDKATSFVFRTFAR
jgi:hypothetical protein